jgi:hypothetical protein
MLKFHEADDIFALKLREWDFGTHADISATIPSKLVKTGDTVRLIAPSIDVDHRVRVLRVERWADSNGDVSTIDGQFVR